MNLTLKIWRQANGGVKGKMVNYTISNVSPDMSFLEMMDMHNEQLIARGEDPVAFDHDCREGICGMCSMFINGEAHGPDRLVTTCQLHMRKFNDGDTIVIEPFRANAFPVIKDLAVDRSAFDRIQQAGGFVSVIPLVTPKMLMQSLSKNMMQIRHLTLLLVLVVVHVWQVAKMPPLCFLSLPRFLNMLFYPKEKLKLLIVY